MAKTTNKILTEDCFNKNGDSKVETITSAVEDIKPINETKINEKESSITKEDKISIKQSKKLKYITDVKKYMSYDESLYML